MIKKFYLAILILVGLLFHTKGINWGIPDRERIDLVFGDEEVLDAFLNPMLSTHEEIREMQVYYGAPYKLDYNPEEKIVVDVKKKKIVISKEMVNTLRSYLFRSYGADEQAAIASLSKMDPSKHNFNPHFFEYGGVYLYPLGAFLKGCSIFKIVNLKSDRAFYLKNPEEIGKLYILSRLFGAIVFILSAIVFFFLSRKISKNIHLAFLSSLLFVVTPVFVLWSHYLKPYTFGLFWVIVTFYGIINFFENRKTGWLIFSSVFAGLSMGTLLSYGYIFFTCICVIFLTSKNFTELLKNLVLSVFFFLFAYFITNPYVIISWKEFINEMFYIQSYWKGSASFENLKYFLTDSLGYGLGKGILLLLIFCLILCFIKREKIFFILFFSLIPGFLYLGLTTGKWVHYAFIVYPYLFLFSLFGLTKIKHQFSVFLILPVLVWTMIFTFAYLNLFSGENIRTSAGRWINENIPEKSKIGIFEAPSPWRTPPFQFLKYNILIGASRQTIKKSEYFIVSEYQWVRGGSLLEIKEMLKGYNLIKEFRKDAKFFKWVFPNPEKIPYDWCHPNPVILIWKKKT